MIQIINIDDPCSVFIMIRNFREKYSNIKHSLLDKNFQTFNNNQQSPLIANNTINIDNLTEIFEYRLELIVEEMSTKKNLQLLQLKS